MIAGYQAPILPELRIGMRSHNLLPITFAGLVRYPLLLTLGRASLLVTERRPTTIAISWRKSQIIGLFGRHRAHGFARFARDGWRVARVRAHAGLVAHERHLERVELVRPDIAA